MRRLANKTVAFGQEVTSYATTNPAFMLPFVSLPDLKRDDAGFTC
ncbi:hypothetical protein [Hymenobacter sp.]|jgi:hypothetical protein